MSAVERLAAAHQAWMDDFTMPNRFVDGMFVADPHLAQDIADGEALRRLREALPEGAYYEGAYYKVAYYKVWSPNVDASGFEVEVVRERRWDDPDVLAHAIQPTIAEAADKCREAIEAQRPEARS